jgi:crossover junction endodeoxyribonuclease RuvC
VPDPSRLDDLTARARRIIAARAGEIPAPAPQASRPPPDDAGQGPRPTSGVPPPAWEDGGQEAVVVGIDPGTATTGFGFLRTPPAGEARCAALAYGVVETPTGAPMPRRLQALYRDLRALLDRYRPTEAAVEKLFFGRNTTTAISVGQARGVVLLALADAGVAVAEYTPAEVKQAMAGFGRADKAQMQRMTQVLLDLPAPPTPDDAADALAIALCHARQRVRRAHGLE